MSDMQRLLLESPLRREHAVAWVAYAAEFGYAYSGESFWPEFEAKTLGWTERGDRQWLKREFQRFAEGFRGARPHSRWAEHFNIISWPIVHGIVPRDLQRILVRLLFEARPTREAFLSAASLGRYLHQAATEGSSRFQELAENEQLLGHIAAALLLPKATSPLISPEALARIVADVNREKAAGTWLEEARRRVARLNIDGLRGTGPGAQHARQPVDAARESAVAQAAIPIEARLELRETLDGEWSLRARIPSFAPIVNVWPEFRHFLSTTRPRWLPGEGRLLARGSLLHGFLQPVDLWPEPGTPLIELDEAPPQLAILANRLRHPIEMPVLFRRTQDGSAVETPSRSVIPGKEYLLVQGTPFVAWPVPSNRIHTDCQGAHIRGITIPERLDTNWTSLLAQLGLIHPRRLTIWPVGSPPAIWDDEGYCEILVGESLSLAVAATGTRGTLEIILDHLPPHKSVVDDSGARHPCFLGFPHLALGEHRVVMTFADTQNPVVTGSLRIVVRHPGATGRSRGTCGAVVVHVAPADLSLEDLWEGRCEVTVAGDPEQKVQCSVDFLAAAGTRVIGKQTLLLSPPVSPSEWATKWESMKSGTASLTEWYDEAASVLLTFDAGDSGRQVLRCPREVPVVRWRVTTRDRVPTLQLCDDSGKEQQYKITFHSFERPLESHHVGTEHALRGITPEGRGGLLIAKDGRTSAGVVCATVQSAHGFAEMRMTPRVEPIPRNASALAAAASVAGDWAMANVRGSSLGHAWKPWAVDAIANACFAAIGGKAWERGEAEFFAGRIGATDLARLIPSGDTSHPVVARLIQFKLDAEEMNPADRMTLLAKAVRDSFPDEAARIGLRGVLPLRKGVRRRVDQSRQLCSATFALCVAQESLLRHPKSVQEAMFNLLLGAPGMTRAVRWVALCCAGRGGAAKEWAWE